MQKINSGVTAPKGFLAGGVHCGVKTNNTAKKDIAIIYSEKPCTAAAVYTQNKAFGAPITVTRRNIADGMAQAVVCNSGNANTCNADGVEKAEKMCVLAAKALHLKPKDIIVASTGVIGQVLPIEPIEKGIAALAPIISGEGNLDAVQAIMTTDTKPKEEAYEIEIGGKTVKIGAMAKGSGMIHPNMATMLGFLTTDAAITTPMLQKALKLAVDDTFNMVSVDGDTSTNDMVSIMANGMAENTPVTAEGEDYDTFRQALYQVLMTLTKMLAKDGEGASKMLECTCSGAPDQDTAIIIAKSVIRSPLFKCAMFGEDANWGRILCAIGYADAEFDINKVDVDLASSKGTIAVCRNAAGVDFSEEKAKEILEEDEIYINIDLHQGEASAKAWGCDLTYDYVKINGDYRS